jgi:hypothetical protein
MIEKENKSALRIENFFCNIRRMKIKGKFLKLVYMQQGFDCTMEKLPLDLKKLIFSFLTP